MVRALDVAAAGQLQGAWHGALRCAQRDDLPAGCELMRGAAGGRLSCQFGGDEAEPTVCGGQ